MSSTSSPEIQKLWEVGLIGPWYLLKNQLDAYELLKKTKNPFFEAGRRFGKTTTGLIHVLEECRKKEGAIWRWCEPWKNQAREIVIPEMEVIQRDCPHNLRFKYLKTDSVFEGPNKSKIYLRGVNEDRGESARGPKADGIVCDEIGSWADVDYVKNEVLRPQTLTTNGQMIEMGTPPEDLGHLYYAYKDKAIRENRFIQKTVLDNDLISRETLNKLMEECGGAMSPAWRREYMCEPVSQPERLVIPEFNETIHVIDDDRPRPDHFDAYVSLDLGFNDNTAIIFGHLDFVNRCLVVEDELLFSGKNSKEITDAAKKVEARLWDQKKPYVRVSDNDPQQIYDMSTMCGYQCTPTRKDDKIAAVNALRLRFTQNKILIKKRCRSLIYQIKVGLWNERRTDFLRGENTGHLDAIDALVYLNRNVNEHRNPYPVPVYGWGVVVTNLPPGVPEDMQRLQEAFASPFLKRTY